jgi:hypothetical protein
VAADCASSFRRQGAEHLSPCITACRGRRCWVKRCCEVSSVLRSLHKTRIKLLNSQLGANAAETRIRFEQYHSHENGERSYAAPSWQSYDSSRALTFGRSVIANERSLKYCASPTCVRCTIRRGRRRPHAELTSSSRTLTHATYRHHRTKAQLYCQ